MQTLLLTKNCLQTAYSAKNGVPIYKGRAVVSIVVCAKKEKKQPSLY